MPTIFLFCKAYPEEKVKRSEINRYIVEALEFFTTQNFVLPPFAHWTREVWRSKHHEVDEIRDRMLGWDVTDFNSGTFAAVGLTLFTMRNGGYSRHATPKPYAEKIMYVRENQVTPLHFHHRKTEDIINRGNAGAGDLVVQLFNSTEDNTLADTPVSVFCDGTEKITEAGGTIVLKQGESITLTPRIYHTFHAINAPALIGEVSSVNEDIGDNYFYHPLPRYPQIVEDEDPFRLLCTEYPNME